MGPPISETNESNYVLGTQFLIWKKYVQNSMENKKSFKKVEQKRRKKCEKNMKNNFFAPTLKLGVMFSFLLMILYFPIFHS